MFPWGLGCVQKHCHYLAGAISATAGRPSPALPQDAWRWIEIPSQELGISHSPLDPGAASGCPVHFLARRIFASSVCPAGLHQSPHHGIPGGFWLAAEAPNLEEPRAPGHWSKSVVRAPKMSRAWALVLQLGAACRPCGGGHSLRWPRQMSGEEEK